ncbi:MAG: adenylate/guanylate cyclase domain-containing protein [Nitrospirales bacterium]|nr:adenylate/guanylate cyclase domain-containing protein [Nitrospirales bacterium]
MDNISSIASELRILLVDDTPANLAVLKEALASEKYKLAFANSGEKALEIIPNLSPNLILLDVMMPGIDGYETCTRLKQNSKTKDIPIIFITAKKETDDIVQGFQVGGVDYITKPFHKEEVCARIRNHLELQFLRKQNEERMKATMVRYLGSELVDTLMESGEGLMGTSEHEVTILFSDIRRFTTLSEELGAQKTINFLNDYFTQMVSCIQKEKGMLDKFIGDAIMAVFGAPIPFEGHADCGVRSAISMVTAVAIYNQERENIGEKPIQIGIGLNSSPVIAGNIGSSERMDYTVIGDGVNLAARLEGATKYYGAQIIISEYTLKDLCGDYQTRELDRLCLKGKTKPCRIYEILDHHTEKTFPNQKQVLGFFNKGLKEYRDGNWKDSISAFREALNLNPHDKACQVFIDRCEILENKKDLKEWEGIWEMESK